METYEELYDIYGDWMTSCDVATALGRPGAHISSHAWPLEGLHGTKRKVDGRQRCWWYSTYEIAMKIDARRKQEEEAVRHDKTLCRTCVYRDWLSGADRTLVCAYSRHLGHHTRHWHKLHGVENALDSAHCPFYEKGDHKHLPSSEGDPLFGGRRSFET